MKKILEGLQVIAKYLPEGDNGEFSADHDILFAGLSCIGAGPEFTEMSPVDYVRLISLGWLIDKKVECWYHLC
jgi:hypothetical protein